MPATIALLALLPALALTPTADSVYAVVDVTVVPMDSERLLPNHTVVVRNGEIVALGPGSQTPVPREAIRIDGSGRYLLPGLAEMHAHIPAPSPSGSLEYAREVLFLYVAKGVTTIRGMLGHPAHLPLRQAVERGDVLGPRIWTSGPSFRGGSVTPAQADSIARATQALGYDFIKIHPGPSREAFDALDRAADEIGIPFSGHVPADVGLARALEAQYASIDHLDGYMEALVADGTAPEGQNAGWFGANYGRVADRARIGELAVRTSDARVWNVPTQSLMESYATDETPEAMATREELQYMPPATREQWIRWKAQTFVSTPSSEVRRAFLETRRELLRALRDAGAGLLLGSDAPQVWNVPGFSVRHELESLVAAGLTPFEALATGTINVARFFGVDDRAGTIAVGKWADFMLLDRNPLADVANVAQPAGVMIRGRWLERSEIEQGLAEIAARYGGR